MQLLDWPPEHSQWDPGVYPAFEGKKNRFQCAWGSLAFLLKLTRTDGNFGGEIPMLFH